MALLLITIIGVVVVTYNSMYRYNLQYCIYFIFNLINSHTHFYLLIYYLVILSIFCSNNINSYFHIYFLMLHKGHPSLLTQNHNQKKKKNYIMHAQIIIIQQTINKMCAHCHF